MPRKRLSLAICTDYLKFLLISRDATVIARWFISRSLTWQNYLSHSYENSAPLSVHVYTSARVFSARHDSSISQCTHSRTWTRWFVAAFDSNKFTREQFSLPECVSISTKWNTILFLRNLLFIFCQAYVHVITNILFFYFSFVSLRFNGKLITRIIRVCEKI